MVDAVRGLRSHILTGADNATGEDKLFPLNEKRKFSRPGSITLARSTLMSETFKETTDLRKRCGDFCPDCAIPLLTRPRCCGNARVVAEAKVRQWESAGSPPGANSSGYPVVNAWTREMRRC